MDTAPVFSINIWEILFMLLNLLLIYLILKRFLYKPVKKMFAMREKEVAETYSKADEAQTEAFQLKTQYEGQIAAAKNDAEEIVRSATKRAQLRSEAMIGDAKNTASNIVERAQEQIVADKKKAVNEMKDGIAEIALLAAENVLEKEMDSADHHKLIDEFIENVGDEMWQS